MSPKKQGKDPEAAGGSAPRGGGTRPLGAAALATMTWAGVLVMRLPDIFGYDGTGGLLIAAIVGLLLGFTPLRRLLWIAAGLTMMLLLVVGFTPLVNAPVRDWLRTDPEPIHPPDAVLVLSGWISNDGHLNEEGVDRLLSGLALAERWRKPLLISTIRPPGHPGISSARDQDRLIGLGADSLELYRADSVASTHDEAVAFAKLAQTKSWHSFTVVCLPSESRGIAFGTLDGPADRLPAFGEWLYERLAWIKYSWKGWL
jgi:uncharacterized SAM-binding protein YcdF (DUF218 family)